MKTVFVMVLLMSVGVAFADYRVPPGTLFGLSGNDIYDLSSCMVRTSMCPDKIEFITGGPEGRLYAYSGGEMYDVSAGCSGIELASAACPAKLRSLASAFGRIYGLAASEDPDHPGEVHVVNCAPEVTRDVPKSLGPALGGGFWGVSVDGRFVRFDISATCGGPEMLESISFGTDGVLYGISKGQLYILSGSPVLAGCPSGLRSVAMRPENRMLADKQRP